MANPIFNSCLGRQSLRTGSVVAGVGAILLSIVFIICMFVLRFKPKTILFDWLPPGIVKVIIAFNLCMTILISIIMIVGALKVTNENFKIYTFNQCQRHTHTHTHIIFLFMFITAKSLFNVAMGSFRLYAGHWISTVGDLYDRYVLYQQTLDKCVDFCHCWPDSC